MISQKDKENILLNAKPSSGYEFTPTFYETFSAGAGKVIDEELSISRSFNNEGYQERKSIIQSLVNSGEIGREVIDANRDKRGKVNFDRIAKSLGDERIKTDLQIEEEKTEMLAMRREYANSVLDKGSGLAGFLGQMNAYMLDPVNIIAMGAGGAGVIKNGLSTSQAVYQAAVRGGSIAAGSEALIQPFVYSYKQEIDSPYTANDALGAIAMAAIGGAALDSTITGISSYLRRVKGDIQKMEDAGLDVPQEVIAAKQKIDAIENQLVEEIEPQVWQAYQERDFSYSAVEMRIKSKIADDYDLKLAEEYKAIEKIAEDNYKAELFPEIGNKLTKKEVKNLEFELKDIQYKIDNLEEIDFSSIGVKKEKGKPARKAKAEAKLEAERLNTEKRQDLQDAKNIIEQRLDIHRRAQEAEAELSRIEQGIKTQGIKDIAERDIKALQQKRTKEQIEKQLEILKEHNRRTAEYNSPAPKVDVNQKPRMRVKTGEDLTGNARVRKEMADNGTLDEYNAELARFNEMEDITIELEDYQGSAKTLAKNLDDEIETVEALSRCYIG